MSLYITNTRKGYHSNAVEEITHYKVDGTIYEKSSFFKNKFDKNVTYYTKNKEKNDDTAKCIVKETSNGDKYLQTVSTGTKTDNLLELSDC